MSQTAALDVATAGDADRQAPDAPLDAVSLSALLASRLCHDLVNPIGALGSGLEVLEDEKMDDMMKDAAIDLIKTGGQKSIALLKYGRLAYGASGGRGATLPMEEAGLVMGEVFTWAKADLDWRLPAAEAPKDEVKTVMIMAYCAADCVPRGGGVSVFLEEAGYVVEAVGKRALLQDDLPAALMGQTADMTAKFAPAYIAGLLAREAGGHACVARMSEEKIRFEAAFGAKNADAG